MNDSRPPRRAPLWILVASLSAGVWCNSCADSKAGEESHASEERPPGMLALFAEEFAPPGDLVASAPHSTAEGGITHVYDVPEGRIVVTVWKGVVHEVIYQTPRRLAERPTAPDPALFERYGEGMEWIEIDDNGLGKIYRRADQTRYAWWAYVRDVTTFGTMDFHEVRDTP